MDPDLECMKASCETGDDFFSQKSNGAGFS